METSDHISKEWNVGVIKEAEINRGDWVTWEDVLFEEVTEAVGTEMWT